MRARQLVCVQDYEDAARRILPKPVWDYYSGGAGEGATLRDSRDAFRRLRFRPRVLRPCSCVMCPHMGLRTVIQGRPVSMPVGVAPTAMQAMAHPGGERVAAKAAAAAGTIFILSTLATATLEEVAGDSPEGDRWLQLYLYRDRDITRQLIRRAEAAGYSAIVLTVDAPIFGVRREDVRNNFRLPEHLRLANMPGAYSEVRGSSPGSAINQYVAATFDPDITWDDVTWLMRETSLPVVVKGILTPEDARIAAALGVQGVIVSTHGGRQVDGVMSSVDALPGVVAAAGPRTSVYLDGGVREGTDVLKAVAMGAAMVFMGRPVLWGLAVAGLEGAMGVLAIVREELVHAMVLTGCGSLQSVTRDLVVHESQLSHL